MRAAKVPHMVPRPWQISDIVCETLGVSVTEIVSENADVNDAVADLLFESDRVPEGLPEWELDNESDCDLDDVTEALGVTVKDRECDSETDEEAVLVPDTE